MANIKIKKLLSNVYKKVFWKNLELFIFGTFISALAFNLFFDKYNVVPTGTSGLSLILSEYLFIDITVIIFIINLMCLLLGLIFFGYEYAIKMLTITFIYPCFVFITSLFTCYIDLEDTSLFLIMIFGGALSGLSTGLIRKSGYSPGGFCVIFDLLHKYFHISVGMASIIINIFIIFISSFTFGIQNALYAIVAMLVSSYIVDKVIIGISDNKVFYIVSEHPLEVRDYVVDILHYNVTIINSRGGYSNKKRKLLMCVVPTIEYIKLKELIREVDNNAFFLIVDAYESSIKKRDINYL